MCEARLRRMALLGLALAALTMTAAGVHHVRCEGTVTIPTGASSGSLPCVETFPGEWLPVLAALGLAGAIAALAAAYRLGRADAKLTAGRVVVGLAAVALLIPAVLPIAGWASVGFDVRLKADQPDGRSYCTGAFTQPPFWLQTPTCLTWLDLIMTPLLGLAGGLAAFAASRGSRSALLAAVATASFAFTLYVAWIVAGEARLAPSSLVPFLGLLLVAAAIPLLRAVPARSA